MLNAETIGGDWPAGLGLPPMIDDRDTQLLFSPRDGRRVGAFAGEEQGAELSEIASADQATVGVFTFDSAEGGRGGEEDPDAMLLDDPPKGTRVRGADRLALVHDRGAAKQQGGIDDVGVADHPTNIGSRPEHLIRLYPIDVAHRPMQGDRVATIVAYHPL